VFFKILEKDEADENGEPIRIPLARMSTVFNADQVDGYDPTPVASRNPDAPIPALDDWIAATGATIHHGGERACFVPATDTIHLPTFPQFRDGASYYSVAFHELTHWTGTPSRCDRGLTATQVSRTDYAFEELVAELGAAFLAADHGLESQPRADHAAYLDAWLAILRDDKRAIFRAARKAQDAADFLHAQQPVVVADAA
jgi:antirestriction protein ArdC